MKGDYSKTCLIRLSFLIRHFLIGSKEIPFNCVHFRLSNLPSTYLFENSLYLLPLTQVFELSKMGDSSHLR